MLIKRRFVEFDTFLYRVSQIRPLIAPVRACARSRGLLRSSGFCVSCDCSVTVIGWFSARLQQKKAHQAEATSSILNILNILLHHGNVRHKTGLSIYRPSSETDSSTTNQKRLPGPTVNAFPSHSSKIHFSIADSTPHPFLSPCVKWSKSVHSTGVNSHSQARSHSRYMRLSTSSCPSVCPHVSAQLLWTDFREIWDWGLLWKSVEKCEIWLKWRKNRALYTKNWVRRH
jgi:hypothetical protein